MNKKGQIIGIVIFAFILIVILMAGFIFGIGSAVTTWTASTIVPELQNLGVIGGVNLTETANVVITPVNNIIQNLSWFTGVMYFFMLVGSLGIAFAFKISGSKWLIGFFFIVMILVLLASILFSNFYEEFSTGTTEFALELQSYVLLSFLVINAPMIIVLIGFIGGVIMFSGMDGDVA